MYNDIRKQPVAAVGLLVAVGLIATISVPLLSLAQERQPVSLYVTVMKGDKLIGGLTKHNFALYEGDKAVDFNLETPEKPASVALLAEFSQSSATHFNDIEAAIAGFIKSANEGNWYALATFSKELQVNVDFTKLHGKIAQGFADLGRPMSGEINTFDAVYDMLRTMRRIHGRRVLIFIGSGFSSLSAHTLDDVRNEIQSTNVTVYCVGAGSAYRGQYSRYLSSHHRMTLLQAESFLRMLADESGGEAWFPRFEQAFPNVMQGISQSMQLQYRLVYTPHVQRDGQFHKVKVEAFQVVNKQRQPFTVLARAGWRY